MTNEIPKEAGKWWAWRLKGDTMVQIGKSRRPHNSMNSGLLVESEYFLVHEKYFGDYDWHRIELPKGWR